MRIRTRLAIWSGLITFVCLMSAGGTVLWLHSRLGLAQVDDRLAGSEGGGGLGLPIARWIAEAHGGSLALGATNSQGTTFMATLPLPAPPAA